MSDQGSSVTLVFYRMGERWWKEPVLNIAAAACQMSNLTHVEARGAPPGRIRALSPRAVRRVQVAIGEDIGTNGMMTNVCRVFSAPPPAAGLLAPS